MPSHHSSRQITSIAHIKLHEKGHSTLEEMSDLSNLELHVSNTDENTEIRAHYYHGTS